MESRRCNAALRMTDEESEPAEEILSIRRDSIVTRVSLGDTMYEVRKYYQPESFERYEAAFGKEMFHIKGNPRERRVHLYKKEAELIAALGGLKRRIVPELYGRDEGKYIIRMEYIPHPTYREVYLGASPEERAGLTKEMVEILAEVHSLCNDPEQMGTLVSRPGSGKIKYLKKRPKKEEQERLRNYLQVIAYHCSEDLQQYWSDKGIDEESLEPKAIRRRIRTFLDEEEKINLASVVGRFISAQDKIVDKNKSFTHGDFIPQNIFCTCDPEAISIIDFDKTRLDDRFVDVVTLLYNNIYEHPFDKEKEMFTLDLVKLYTQRTGLDVDWEDVLAKLVSLRLQGGIKWFAAYCQMSNYELREQIKGIGKYSGLEDAVLKPAFLTDLFITYFRDFFDYFRFRGGEGWELFLERNPKREIIREQLESIEEFFKSSRILKGVVEGGREKEFKRIIADNAQ